MSSPDDSWIEPEQSASGRADAAQLRKACQDQLGSAARNIGAMTWELAGIDRYFGKELSRALDRGVAEGIRFLRQRLPAGSDPALLFEPLRANLREPTFPYEPLVSPELDAELPRKQKLAYRLTAVVLACATRTAVEDVHVVAQNNHEMPAFNRGLRESFYRVLLESPECAWYLSHWPRGWIEVSGTSNLPDFVLDDA